MIYWCTKFAWFCKLESTYSFLPTPIVHLFLIPFSPLIGSWWGDVQVFAVWSKVTGEELLFEHHMISFHYTRIMRANDPLWGYIIKELAVIEIT